LNIMKTVAVTSIRKLPVRERDMNTLSFASRASEVRGSVKMTDDHLVWSVQQHEDQCLPAKDLNPGIHNLILKASSDQDVVDCKHVQIECITSRAEETQVIAVELEEASSPLFLASSLDDGTPRELYIVVFGAPPDPAMLAVIDDRRRSIKVILDGKEPLRDATSTKRCSSDSTHTKQPEPLRLVRRFRGSHVTDCYERCRYDWKGKCKNGSMCTRCHQQDHTFCSRDRSRKGKSSGSFASPSNEE